MWKWINIFLVLMLVPSVAMATPVISTGAFTRLLEGEKVRFDAWCYDDLANAQILSGLQRAKEMCEATTQRELAEQEQKFLLQIKNLNVRIRTEGLNYAQSLLSKDRQIQSLESAALKVPNDYSVWWAGGGFLAGVLLSVGIVYATR